MHATGVPAIPSRTGFRLRISRFQLLRDLRSAAMRGRAAFGPKDSIRDVLPAEVTEPLLEAVDRLLRELNRYDRTAR